jgi:hypothetical protein
VAVLAVLPLSVSHHVILRSLVLTQVAGRLESAAASGGGGGGVSGGGDGKLWTLLLSPFLEHGWWFQWVTMWSTLH